MLFSNEACIFDRLNVKTLTVYTKQPINDNSELSGNGYKISCSVEDYKNLKNQSNVQGISFETNFYPDEIINKLNLKIQDIQNIVRENETISIYYCYMENVDNSVFLSNKKVNLQIAFNGEKCVIGLPLILGSY